MKNENKARQKSPVLSLLTGLGISYAFTVLVFIVYAILLTYTEVTEKNLPLVVMITVVVSVLIAGFDAAKGAKQKGWLWGMGAGFIYAFIMILIGMCFKPSFSVDAKTIVTLILSLAGGGLGGIIGVNISKK